MGRRPLRWLLMVVSVAAAALLILELTLTVAAGLSPLVAGVLAPPWRPAGIPAALADPRLGVRPNPAFPGHDARGFRNPVALDRAPVVTLGDSQTYGHGVPPGTEWPQVLAATTGQAVYNLAFGSYGATHSLELLPTALSLKPALVIAAIYSGNDNWDCYYGGYQLGQGAGLPAPEPELVPKLAELEARQPLKAYLDRLAGLPASRPEGPPPGWRRFLSEHSRTWALGRRAWYEGSRRVRALGNSDLVRAAGATTVFTPRYRLVAVDTRDPRIAEGQRLCLAALEAMAARVTAAGARFLVVLIPTKELVYSSTVPPGPPELVELIRRETDFWREVRRRLERGGIPHVDTLPALRDALARGERPYRVTADGHPTPEGHRAIAEAVASAPGGTGAP